MISGPFRGQSETGKPLWRLSEDELKRLRIEEAM
jgi:hypothetical protein